MNRNNPLLIETSRMRFRKLLLLCLVLHSCWNPELASAEEPSRRSEDTERVLAQAYETSLQALLQKHCAECHAGEKIEADIDLGQFKTFAQVQQQPEVWLKISEMLESRQMPPPEAAAIPDQERDQVTQWVKRFLRAEAERRAGDPGPVVLRRLNNAEYTYAVRDLTGVSSLSPALEFPADSGAGEGFTNSGQAQAMSPALLTKYFDAGKALAEHVVLLPDGFRFSPSTTRRDWTESILADIRKIYAQYSDPKGATKVNLQGIVFDTNGGGRLPIEQYLLVASENRDLWQQNPDSLRQIALDKGLSPRYLDRLWHVLEVDELSQDSWLLYELRSQWKQHERGSVHELAAWIARWQQELWRFTSVGHIGKVGGPKSWMEPVTPKLDSPELTSKLPETEEQRTQALADFRQWFPLALCYTKIVPVDEVVTLTLYYREDEPLRRLMLEDVQVKELDRLWNELHFVSQDAFLSVDAFEQLWQYATQDADPSAFEPLRQPLLERAAEFREQMLRAEPTQIDAVIRFAETAYRRPLRTGEAEGIRSLYHSLRHEELSHDAAVRLLMARIFVSPSFLYRSEQGLPSKDVVAREPPSQPISDEELATRLSFFLWSSVPDETLRSLASQGKLNDEEVLRSQIKRMLNDPRASRLATEFGCQWLHVYEFDLHDEKSETHFPEFRALRGDMYEETQRFLTDLIQRDGSILDLIQADHTFVNAALAKHYGLAAKQDEAWHRVEGLRDQGRGGILGMATVLAKQSGASRTSPILRGNWVSEVLLGEKLPRPPKNVPPLPDEVPAGLTERALIERHSSDAACAKCHQRIDPFGFALEGFDAIGRQRQLEPGQTRAKLMDGREMEGLGGLRDYLLTTKREAFVKQFCRKLLGYALGRAVQLSDEPLLERIQSELERDNFRVHVAVQEIVLSDPFRRMRSTSSPLSKQISPGNE